MKKWTQTEIEYLKTNYQTKTQKEIAHALQRSYGSIGGMSSILGLKKEIISKPGNRIYKINEQFFKSHTQEMAYVVGFLLADGNIEPLQRAFEATSSEAEVLEKIRDAMQSTHPISLARGRLFRLRIGSKILVTDLVKIGVFPKKSKTACLPKISSNLFFHFLRGFLDGDGGIYQHKGIYIKFTSGSYILLADISKTISMQLLCDLRQVKEHHQFRRGKPTTWYTLSYYGKTALALGKAMYQNAGSLYLSRKKQMFDKQLALYNPFNGRYLYDTFDQQTILAHRRERNRIRQAEYRKRKKLKSIT